MSAPIADAEARKQFYETAEKIARLLAEEELRAGIKYTYTGALSMDGAYEIEIRLEKRSRGSR